MSAMNLCDQRAFRQISRAYEGAYRISFNDNSKFVIMSDCHRSDGSYADNFAKNQDLFFAALEKYNFYHYTYIELGDGDELWENNRMTDIIDVYNPIFWLLSQFYKSNRFYSVYGNHDMVKQNRGYCAANMEEYFDIREKKKKPLFPGITFFGSLLLTHDETGDEIFLLHGHQADFPNDTLWRVSRFLVRFLWKPLEMIGVNDPTSAAKNYRRKKRVERILSRWIEEQNRILIAGHTHRSVFPELGEPLYFNTGSCVHPRCVSAIEIAGGSALLVKWCHRTRVDGTVYVGREVLVGPVKLRDLFQQLPR